MKRDRREVNPNPRLYGFGWGPFDVTRLAHIEDRGYVIEVRTDYQTMQIRISENGRKITAHPARTA